MFCFYFKRLSVVVAAVLSAAVLAGSFAGPAAAETWNPEGYKKMGAALTRRDSTVNLRTGVFSYQLWSEAAKPDWTRRTNEAIQLMLPQFETVFDMPMTWETVLVIAEKDSPATQWNYYNQVHIRQGSDLIAVAHGLAHLWVSGNQLEASWAQEGVAHWAAIDALRRAGFADEARAAFDASVRDFLDGYQQMDGLLPSLNTRDGVEDQYRYALAKATAFVTVIRSAMPPTAFRQFLNSIASAIKPFDNDGFRELYDEVSGQSGDGLFQGWASTGRYQIYSAKSFEDTDGDGLVDVVEAGSGTHPKTEDSDTDGLSDGYEFWHMLNPTERSSGGTQEDLAAVGGIAVDGLSSDWEARSVPPIYEDAVGDGLGADLQSVFAAVDGSRFCVMAEFHGRLPVAATTTIYTHIKTTGRNETTTTLANTLDGSRNWVVRSQKGRPPANNNTPTRPGRALKVFETCVDASSLTGVRTVKVNLVVQDDRSQTNLDDMGGWWAPVELSTVRVK